MNSLKTIDVIVPCYNPTNGWDKRLVTQIKILEGILNNYKLHFILVDDGSSQNLTQQHIDFIQENISYISYVKLKTNKGKGAAIRKGFELSKGEFALFTDVDFPYRIENICGMILKLEQGADIVIGLRNKEYYENIPKTRAILSKFFKFLIKFLFKIPNTETQAGLKAFSCRGREIVLQTRINRYLFDLELVKLAHKKPLKFAYITLGLNEGIELSKMSFKVLFNELGNLFKILIR